MKAFSGKYFFVCNQLECLSAVFMSTHTVHTSCGNNEQDLSVKTLNMELNLLVFATIPAISFLHINLLAEVTMPFLYAAWTRRIMVI